MGTLTAQNVKSWIYSCDLLSQGYMKIKGLKFLRGERTVKTKKEFPFHVIHTALHIKEPKCIGTGQPARTAQADLSRNFLLLVISLHIKGPY